MNVIFLDFDGVITTYHENKEKNVAILADICKQCNASVVISAGVKGTMDPETLKTDVEYAKEILELLKKYNINCIGRTPCIGRNFTPHMYTTIWKEDEIRVYLFNHPEIEHYVVIDDVEYPQNSDLRILEDHLVKPLFYSKNPEEEGLTEKHIEEVKEKMKLENEYKKFAEKKQGMKR